MLAKGDEAIPQEGRRGRRKWRSDRAKLPTEASHNCANDSAVMSARAGRQRGQREISAGPVADQNAR